MLTDINFSKKIKPSLEIINVLGELQLRTTDFFRENIRIDPRLTVVVVMNKVSISNGSQNVVLTDELGTKKVSSKLVPKLLTEHQIGHRII